MEVNVLSTSNSYLCKVNVQPRATILDVKNAIAHEIPRLKKNRQSVRVDVKGKDLQDTAIITDLILSGSNVYVKDLGVQIGWRTVFILEYLGPLVIYIAYALRPSIIYENREGPYTFGAKLALACWFLHYIKRLYETIYVHRFSHATMPILNLFKNCAYYWGFAAYIAQHTNHPLYTEASQRQIITGTVMFLFSELGNFSIHLLLRDLRPPGTTARKIPMPNGNLLTRLYNYVSCPNYTYEFTAWLGFSMLSSCFPALVFALLGMAQMTHWAVKKHIAYRKEFRDYPKNRKAIVPYLI